MYKMQEAQNSCNEKEKWNGRKFIITVKCISTAKMTIYLH